MKILRIFCCITLSLILSLSPSLAAELAYYPPSDHTEQLLPSRIAVSPWAQEEVDWAIASGFGPTADEHPRLPESLSQPVSRGEFCTYAARFIAFQQGCDALCLTETIISFHAQRDQYGQPESVFSDISGTDPITAMYYLGVAKGRGYCIFDREAKLTRQEAAVFLTRIYGVYGGKLPEAPNGYRFIDQEQIAPWAEDSVAALAQAGIMTGYEDGRFAPGDPYSYEQCLATLVRLSHDMPTSRERGNVTPLYTYEQYLSAVERDDQLADERNYGLFLLQQVDGSAAVFVQQRYGGVMTSKTFYKFIYRSGAMRSFYDFGVCNTGYGFLRPSTELLDAHFSEDGKTFYCTIILEESIESPSEENVHPLFHSHEAGLYQISVDVETCKAQAVKL